MFGEFLCFLVVALPVGYLIYRYFQGRKLVANDAMFSQNYVTVDYHSGIMTVRGKSFEVGKVTGVVMQYYHNNKKFAHRLVVNVDDMAKPVHRVTIIGSKERAGVLMQRVCVALRKAGGPNFI